MPTTITMPQLGETVTEGTVAQWLKRVGDTVEKYEPFVEVSTDKVNAEVPSPVSGTIRELIVKEGETVPTGAPIAIIDEVGAAAAAPPQHAPAPTEAVAAQHTAQHAASNGARRERVESGSHGLRVSPAVRRLAREHHIDYSAVSGSGYNGRVTANDILAAAKAGPSAAAAALINADNAEYVARPAAAAAPAAAPAPAAVAATVASPAPGDLIPLTQARKLIAQRMRESKNTMVEVDVTDLWKRRAREKDAFESANGVKLTLLPFFMHAVVESLAQFPLMNASFTDEGIRVHKSVNLGIAAAVEGNLVVPVVRNADQLSIKGLALAAGALIDKARRGRLGADDLAGGTFTVNNTGANGSVLSAPILVPGQAGIVTMEAVVKRAVVRADDSIAIRSMMNVCLSLDHRVIDGAVASGFLVDLKRRLEAMGTGTSLR
jgi:2-oxoisovalerate dehydrogenase E2 component (dihydrolipoyl transacylase)